MPIIQIVTAFKTNPSLQTNALWTQITKSLGQTNTRYKLNPMPMRPHDAPDSKPMRPHDAAMAINPRTKCGTKLSGSNPKFRQKQMPKTHWANQIQNSLPKSSNQKRVNESQSKPKEAPQALQTKTKQNCRLSQICSSKISKPKQTSQNYEGLSKLHKQSRDNSNVSISQSTSNNQTENPRCKIPNHLQGPPKRALKHSMHPKGCFKFKLTRST